MIFGYARVSTMEQSLNRQLNALKLDGAEEIIQEKITGTKADRPELNRLLNILRKGDVVLITDLTRLSRSTKDALTKNGVDINTRRHAASKWYTILRLF